MLPSPIEETPDCVPLAEHEAMERMARAWGNEMEVQRNDAKAVALMLGDRLLRVEADDFWQRYYSDPWVFNLANAVQALSEHLEQTCGQPASDTNVKAALFGSSEQEGRLR
jgi:hypothetical protein